jgi:hypothetical protein
LTLFHPLSIALQVVVAEVSIVSCQKVGIYLADKWVSEFISSHDSYSFSESNYTGDTDRTGDILFGICTVDLLLNTYITVCIIASILPMYYLHIKGGESLGILPLYFLSKDACIT